MKTPASALAALLLCSSAVNAFYFPGWPGAIRPPAPVLVTETSPGDPPSVRSPEPTVIIDNPTTPNNVPEPATLILAGIGIGCAMKRMNRK